MIMDIDEEQFPYHIPSTLLVGATSTSEQPKAIQSTVAQEVGGSLLPFPSRISPGNKYISIKLISVCTHDRRTQCMSRLVTLFWIPEC